MRLLLLFVATLPCLAQFQSMEFTIEGIGCATCIESLPARITRMRGVESATIDAEHGIVKIQLAAENRVRPEQVRDMIEQDGTKATKAAVRVRGELSRTDKKWVLRPTPLSTSYEVESNAALSAAGTHIVFGNIVNLRPQSGPLVIRATELKKAE